MKKKCLMLNWTLSIIVLASILLPFQAESSQSDIQIILDSSRFSGEKLGDDTKLNVSVNHLIDILNTIDLDCNISLRVHGGASGKSVKECENTRLVIPFSKFNPKKWEDALKSQKSLGEPSIYNAIESSLKDFPNKKDARNNIIMINFSPRTCEKDLRELVKIIDTQKNRTIFHLIDYGADSKTRQELSMPVGVSGGSFFMPMTKAEFKKQIIETLDLSINSSDLLIETIASNGKEIYFEYHVTEQESNRLVSKHETNSIKAVMPGVYIINVITIPEKKAENVIVKNGELTKLSISGFTELLVKVINPNGKESKVHFTIRNPENDSFSGSGDSGRPVIILEGKYKLTVQTIPYTIEEIEIKEGENFIYTVKNLGFMKIEVKNKPATFEKVKVVIRNQEDNQYIMSCEVPNTLEMVEGVYKFILYADKKLTKENIRVKAMETSKITLDFADL